MPAKQLSQRHLEQAEFRIVREEGAAPKLEGYAALFNTPTDLGYATEDIAPGAFAESLARPDDVRALFNHDPSLILGRNLAGTLGLREDERGLRVIIEPPDTQLGRDLVASIARGDISQMSFGFYPEEEEIIRSEGKKTHFRITKAKLFDVSPVTYPAYPETEISVKRDMDRRKAQLEETLKNEGADARELRRRKIFLLKIA